MRKICVEKLKISSVRLSVLIVMLLNWALIFLYQSFSLLLLYIGFELVFNTNSFWIRLSGLKMPITSPQASLSATVEVFTEYMFMSLIFSPSASWISFRVLLGWKLPRNWRCSDPKSYNWSGYGPECNCCRDNFWWSFGCSSWYCMLPNKHVYFWC